MISALDTSVLLDIFLPDPVFVKASQTAMHEAFEEGSLVICEPVYAELACFFKRMEQLDHILEQSQIRVEPISREASHHAGQCFRAYRDSGGKRERIITDFLVGSHALKKASRLISRDRGFYRNYFKDLVILEPV